MTETLLAWGIRPVAYMALGAPTYGTSVLAQLAVGNVAAALEPYPTVTLEQMRAAGARVVLAPSEPYPWRARHLSELRAVAPVVEIDGKDLFWWGAPPSRSSPTPAGGPTSTRP